jgi:hypothetical protein
MRYTNIKTKPEPHQSTTISRGTLNQLNHYCSILFVKDLKIMATFRVQTINQRLFFSVQFYLFIAGIQSLIEEYKRNMNK